MLASQITLTPLSATILIFLAVLAGNRYRRVWKAEGPRWQLWRARMRARTRASNIGRQHTIVCSDLSIVYYGW